MIARIVDGKRRYLGENIPSRISDRPSIRRYQLWEHLHEEDGFKEAVLATVPEGYILLDESWTQEDGKWVQGGTLIEREQHELEQAQARAEELASQYAVDVAILVGFLSGFGYELPVPDVQATIDEIKMRLATGDIPASAHGTVALLVETYRELKSVMSDEEIVAVAQYEASDV